MQKNNYIFSAAFKILQVKQVQCIQHVCIWSPWSTLTFGVNIEDYKNEQEDKLYQAAKSVTIDLFSTLLQLSTETGKPIYLIVLNLGSNAPFFLEQLDLFKQHCVHHGSQATFKYPDEIYVQPFVNVNELETIKLSYQNSHVFFWNPLCLLPPFIVNSHYYKCDFEAKAINSLDQGSVPLEEFEEKFEDVFALQTELLLQLAQEQYHQFLGLEYIYRKYLGKATSLETIVKIDHWHFPFYSSWFEPYKHYLLEQLDPWIYVDVHDFMDPTEDQFISINYILSLSSHRPSQPSFLSDLENIERFFIDRSPVKNYQLASQLTKLYQMIDAQSKNLKQDDEFSIHKLNEQSLDIRNQKWNLATTNDYKAALYAWIYPSYIQGREQVIRELKQTSYRYKFGSTWDLRAFQQNLPAGTPRFIPGWFLKGKLHLLEIYHQDDDMGFVQAKVTPPAYLKIGILPYTDKTGTITYPLSGTFQGTWELNELKFAYKFKYQIEIIAAVIYDYKQNSHLFFNKWLRYYNLKVEQAKQQQNLASSHFYQNLIQTLKHHLRLPRFASFYLDEATQKQLKQHLNNPDHLFVHKDWINRKGKQLFFINFAHLPSNISKIPMHIQKILTPWTYIRAWKPFYIHWTSSMEASKRIRMYPLLFKYQDILLSVSNNHIIFSNALQPSDVEFYDLKLEE